MPSETLPEIRLAAPNGLAVILGLQRNYTANHPVEPGSRVRVVQTSGNALYTWDMLQLQGRAVRDLGRPLPELVPWTSALGDVAAPLGTVLVKECLRFDLNTWVWVLEAPEPEWIREAVA